MSRKQRINQLISEELEPSFLEVEDESSRHHVPDGAETHFKLSIVSEKFNDLTKIARHRILNKLLAEELNSGLHALSLHLYTAKEWQTSGQITAKSPACRDGFRHG
ncbi:MAG: BolA family transcriptional regulator [Tatlockia sp.]|nr:BolA family transcriptional regulator [Tatlockia sp.]